MRFYDSPSIERIGFDFYCDIANNIVKLREENGFTQKDLAVKTGIKEYRISNMENVKIRIDLDAVEELAKALNVWERGGAVYQRAVPPGLSTVSGHAS